MGVHEAFLRPRASPQSVLTDPAPRQGPKGVLPPRLTEGAGKSPDSAGDKGGTERQGESLWPPGWGGEGLRQGGLRPTGKELVEQRDQGEGRMERRGPGEDRTEAA